MKNVLVVAAVAALLGSASADVVVDFDALWTTGNNTYDMPSTFGALAWENQGIQFMRTRTDWGGGWSSWDGTTFSSVNNPLVGGSGNQYAVSGSGLDVSGAGSYGVFFEPWSGGTSVVLPVATEVKGFYANNTAYAADTILNGDGFARAFSTASNDLFSLTIEGFDSVGSSVGIVDFNLADYTGVTGEIVDEWTWVDLSSLGGDVKSLQFNMSSTEGNTPNYFAMDELTVAAIPEPGTVTLMLLGFGGMVWFRKKRTYFLR
ncbi:hypothetical protein PDESU_03485 [Pontiella desulfatans]|uniref:Ice-binding protein C-terminal domain-containing protein n=1 Tax=Pontiella desulfatans TaxID=2750659 RepID=A0A6C2U4T9_PONDE|nr:DUF4465 domain-containing protein [Pontiella desulfatans]VGO14915.1 hypothetical protein PDESU_03485 [Pontiella desulfatans]